MSLAPKIDEIRCCVLDWKPDVACFTETWLHASINDNHIDIPEYNFISKNRTTGIHGGVGLYIKNFIKFRLLAHLQVNNMEVLWVWLRPKRLPRGVPCVIIGTIYHPPNADDSEMLDYLSTTLTIIEGQYPGCGIFLAGDFNRLNVNHYDFVALHSMWIIFLKGYSVLVRVEIIHKSKFLPGTVEKNSSTIRSSGRNRTGIAQAWVRFLLMSATSVA